MTRARASRPSFQRARASGRLLGLFLLAALSARGAFGADAPEIANVAANKAEVGRFDLYELTFDVSARPDNPYDPAQLEVLGRFISPTGQETAVPGFFYQGFRREADEHRESLTKTGPARWKVRFTPAETGAYRYVLESRAGGRSFRTAPKTFRVKASHNPGFLRADPGSVHYLKFDSGRDFFGVGESVAWGKRGRITLDYDYYFGKLAESGCNYSRVWLVDWNLPIEWTPEDRRGGESGLGRYRPEESWKLDYVIGLAKRHGLYLVLTLDSYGSLMDKKGSWNEQKWDDNPYNAKNGGPCASPADFWTDPAAKDFYKRRLRYILARWGYSPHILAFELWNEVNAPADWIAEMADYIKRNDPNRHLVTTSVGSISFGPGPFDESGTWRLPGIDYTQNHLYGSGGNLSDMAQVVLEKSLEYTGLYEKPFTIAEFGLDFSADDAKYDKQGQGTHLHNAFWAGAVGGSFAIPMTHWKEYVDRKDLYREFAAISRFVSAVEWTRARRRPARIENISYAPFEPRYGDLFVDCTGDWGEGGGEEITVSPDGAVRGKVNRYVHGMSKAGELRRTPVFHVDFARPGRILMDVDSVSQGADLRVYVDGKRVWRRVFRAGPGQGEWKSSKFDKRYKIHIARYGQSYEVPIPKGKHVVRFENVGVDWVSWNRLTFQDYLDNNAGRLRVAGLSSRDDAVLWIQNKGNTWVNVYRGVPVPPIRDAAFDLAGLSDGEYEVEWWDCYEGKPIGSERVSSERGRMRLSFPEVRKDIACIVRKKSG